VASGCAAMSERMAEVLAASKCEGMYIDVLERPND
jgi:hypothetical protein